MLLETSSSHSSVVSVSLERRVVEGLLDGFRRPQNASSPPAANSTGPASPFPHISETPRPRTAEFLIQEKHRLCVSKYFPKTSNQTKLDSQQQRNQMRTKEENYSGSATMVLPGCQRRIGVWRGTERVRKYTYFIQGPLYIG